jgi:DNA-binding IscR family transcriptional regulator
MKISKEKREKISEQILAFLFQNSPKLLFTVEIAKEVARDEEFIKDLLSDLKKKGLVSDVRKNPEGISYLKRTRWKMTDEAYEIYKKRLHTN